MLAVCGILYAWELLTRCCLNTSATMHSKLVFPHNGNGGIRRFHSELVHSKCHRIPSPVVTLLALRIGLWNLQP